MSTNNSGTANPPSYNITVNGFPVTFPVTTTGATGTGYINPYIVTSIPNYAGGIAPPPVVSAQCEPKKKKDSDGCTCKKCEEFYPYAEPNQEDGTLICYACRHGI